MQIAILNPCYWPEVRRGSERFAHDLAGGLYQEGHRPRLLTSHPGPRTVTVEEQIEIVRVARPPERPLRWLGFPGYTSHVPLLYRELCRGDDDIAHALFPTTALAANRWSRRTGRPSVLSVMGVPRHSGLTSSSRYLAIWRSAVQQADAVTALSQAAAAAVQRHLGVIPRIIAPGVALEAFTPAERADSPTIFCPVAMADPRKRVPLLLEALPHVRRRLPGTRLVLDRPRDARLAAQAASVDGVELVPVDDHAALVAGYGRAWVTVLPSQAEAFGLVLVESLACGTPVVGTDDGGIAEIIDRPSIGRRFTGGAAELAEALIGALQLVLDPATTGACISRAEAFSVRVCAAAHADLYAELLA